MKYENEKTTKKGRTSGKANQSQQIIDESEFANEDSYNEYRQDTPIVNTDREDLNKNLF